MNPEKYSVDNQRECVNRTTRIPGAVGWGIERPQLQDHVKMLTDDTRVDSFPIPKDHVHVFDKNINNRFIRYHGARAAEVDKKLGVDYSVYS